MAWFSLLGALAAAVVAVSALMILRDPPREAAPQRSLTSYPVRWTCERNPDHEFTADGRFDPLPCRHPGCPGQCSIRLRYVCIEHNRTFDAWVRFERTPDSPERISEYRYTPTGPWRSTTDGSVPCPLAGCRGETRPSNSAWSELDFRRRDQ
jgi:hypothetical protein